ncbi:cellulase family glycosylhydrolase [uncultured Ruminococcus sp.]|uniref:cellulase family glycosylhydrolase n=1 Tax=uncultured Ruminococcus sp. TaxID=165186 RepID=UPI0025FEDA04|nr:cellulase family glycosylhydrolase [uncultured Ruminococcus sp.]
MVNMQINFRAVKRTAAVMLSAALLALSMPAVPADAASKGFYVSGTSIKDANGNDFVMRGVNIAHAWYNSRTATSIKGAANNGANTVRVVVADGKKWSRTTKSTLTSIVNECRKNDLVCILEVHDATGSDSTSDLKAAVDYWTANKSVLQGNEKYVILNIANEWYGSWDGSSWAEGNRSAVKSIRKAGINNMIMVDCAGWGQYPDSIKDYGKSVFNADSQKNTVFSIHMYEYAGGDPSTVKKNIDNALGIGVPVVIGEFGGQHTNGDVDEATIMSYCTKKNVGYLGWSWKGNSSDLSYLDIANDWAGTSLTSWGNTLINGSYGIKKTSKKCSVFTGGSSSSSGSSSSGNSSSSSSSSGNSSSSSSSSGSSSSSSSGSSSKSDPYISLFWGKNSAGAWGQPVSVTTAKNGGTFDAANFRKNGYFYVEYTNSAPKQIELILQSWSGGGSWAKVQAYEFGSANGHSYAKFSYNDCVNAFGTSNFSSYLDRIHVGCMQNTTTVYSVCCCYPK